MGFRGKLIKSNPLSKFEAAAQTLWIRSVHSSNKGIDFESYIIGASNVPGFVSDCVRLMRA